MPRPGTPVLPDLTGVRAVAATAMSATCTIIDRDTSAQRIYNPATHSYDETPATVYAGPCRVQPVAISTMRNRDVGERSTALRDYQVSIPVTATAVRHGNQVTITANPADARLVDLALIVVDEVGASIAAERALLCQTVENPAGD